MLTILFDGIAYGMLLFVLSCGLVVTLGLMNFVNLAHGAFAMAGGYVTVVLMNRLGMPFLATLPCAFLATAVIGLVLERMLYRHLYGRSPLDQVLFSIGLVFMASAGTDYVMGSDQQIINLPAFLRGRVEVLGISIGVYRFFIIVLCGLLTVALQLVLSRTRFGSRLRAAVDDPRVARGLGIDVTTLRRDLRHRFRARRARRRAGRRDPRVGPTFPLKFMIYFLIVVTVGGTSSITGPFVASLILGIADVAGKYYVPSLGAFVIYTVMIALLILRPRGLFARAR